MKNAVFPVGPVALAGLLAGTLDATAATVFLAKMRAAAVFKFIASGAFGTAAFSGGADMVAWGVVFHYFIALSWTVLYFWVYPQVLFLQKTPWWLHGILYGILVWVIMNLLVLPLTSAPHENFSLEGVSKGLVILVFCIGLPIAWLAGRTVKPAKKTY